MRFLIDNIKNSFGWKTNRKLIVFAVDDYGNVRLHSKGARLKLDKEGLPVKSRFDAFDALETREDLDMLFDVLDSVKDKNGNHAVFTTFALPCNINFEQMEEDGYEEYTYELLPETYKKLSYNNHSAYYGAWELWREGIEKKMMVPEFHGREHFNVKVFEEKLRNKDRDLIINLQSRSYTSISTGYSTIKPSAAFAFSNKEDILTFPEIISSGLKAFKEVFANPAHVFTPPAHQFPVALEASLSNFDIYGLDKPFYCIEHLGRGKYRRRVRTLRYDSGIKLTHFVRNVVFEPTQGSTTNWVGRTLKEIEAAFRWKRPAIISSHRVNFCGHIDPKNRLMGLTSLSRLLKAIIKKWPDVEFISATELTKLISNKG